MARRYYTLRYFKNFECTFMCLLVVILHLCNILLFFYLLTCLFIIFFDYLCRPKNEKWRDLAACNHAKKC